MNRRLLLKPMYPHVVSLGEGGYVGYDGVGISFDKDVTAMQVWQWGDWSNNTILPVNSGDKITIKRPLPYRTPEKSVREIINNIDRGRGLTASEIIDRATTHLAREEETSRSQLLYDMLRAGSLNINPFFKVPHVQHNKLLLKRKKS